MNQTPEALSSFQWALPQLFVVPPDPLMARIDIHQNAILLTTRVSENKEHVTEARLVSANELAKAMAGTIPMRTGLLGDDTLWWEQTKNGPLHALWRPPGVWRVTIMETERSPIKRLSLPMPGLVFLCQSARPPWLFAARKRPTKEDDQLYHAPVFNVYYNGESCGGSHRYPERVEEIPESFFSSIFSGHGDRGARSITFGEDLFALWASLDGQNEYPMDDLVPSVKVADAMKVYESGVRYYQ